MAFVFICIIIGLKSQCNLTSKHLLGNAKIDACGVGGGRTSGFWIDYTLEVNGEKFKNSSLYDIYKLTVPMVRKYFIGKTFPAAYYPSNPSNSHLLILPEDFENFGYKFPDSLSWVKAITEKKNDK
ncbi:hypothetical protein [Arachidicoccus terrestris]|uniref:hypothetical protein n=1 Tax=Arachidicoccus terrestris TaxID=2875539 RepID=UPI001CC5D43E|nr:hypothetical protein [Arachidicoccus terrestris]UAY54276.1 hypothetical protein K9M52_12520 [Arachidicoccus terrestris]